jgi:hypothetical protein
MMTQPTHASNVEALEPPTHCHAFSPLIYLSSLTPFELLPYRSPLLLFFPKPTCLIDGPQLEQQNVRVTSLQLTSRKHVRRPRRRPPATHLYSWR